MQSHCWSLYLPTYIIPYLHYSQHCSRYQRTINVAVIIIAPLDGHTLSIFTAANQANALQSKPS